MDAHDDLNLDRYLLAQNLALFHGSGSNIKAQCPIQHIDGGETITRNWLMA